MEKEENLMEKTTTIKLAALSGAAATLLFAGGVLGLNQSMRQVKSENNHGTNTVLNTDSKKMSPVLEIQDNKAKDLKNDKISVNKHDNLTITTATDENTDVIDAVKVVNDDTQNSVSIVNDGVTIELTQVMYNQTTKNFDTTVNTYPVPANNIQMENYYGSWYYTGSAVGDSVLATIVDATALVSGYEEIVSAAAAVLKVTYGFFGVLLGGYIIQKVGDPGATLANYLDKNHNGWIGIYRRHYYLSNGTYDSRYDDGKTE